MHIVAVIPARGGSKTIPDKCIKPLCGIPLIEYTINAVKKTKAPLTEWFVFTDKYTQYKTLGIERPDSVSHDQSKMIDTLSSAVCRYERAVADEADVVILLQPCSPFLYPDDIEEALTKFIDSKCKSLVSVTTTYALKKFYNERGMSMEYGEYQKQSDGDLYVRNGAIFIMDRSYLRNGYIYGPEPEFYFMPKLRSIEIDDEEDFLMAEALINQKVVGIPWRS